MRNCVYGLLLVISLCSGSLLAQTVVKVASDLPPSEGNLNRAVQAAITAGTLSKTTFQLEPFGYYVLTGTINVPAGQRLAIEGPTPGSTQATAPPQIVWSATSGADTRFNFDCFGDISLKNVWLLYANSAGDQVGSCLQMEDDPLSTARRATFDGVMFDYSRCPSNSSSGAVSVACTKLRAAFQNCYFKNCIDKHFRYYGRALSFVYGSAGWHSDSVSFVNCTFANMGYVYMQEGEEYADYVKFNHCTFLDVVMHSLEYGWWNKLAVTNCIFVNTYMLGNIPAQTGAYDVNGGTLRIDSVSTFGFSVPYTEQDRRILFANSSYCVEKWLVDWMANNPNSKVLRQTGRDLEIPQPMPMLSPLTLRFFDFTANGQKVFPYMNRANLYDATDPGFILAPTDTALTKAFLLKKWTDNTDTNWAWKPLNSINGLWPLEENLAYRNANLKTVGLGGFPLGDLYHWWPTQYASWKMQEASEDQLISNMLNNITVVAPAAPALSSPANGEAGVSINPILQWQTSAGAASYRIQLATDANFASIISDATGTTAQRQVGPLSNNTRYYWRVSATNTGGTSSFSSTWYFTTAAGTPAISLSSTTVDFGTVAIGTSSQKTFTVSNAGSATLVVSSITSNNAIFTVNPSSFQVSAGAAGQTVTVTFTPTAARAYSATITVNHNAAGSPSTVAISGTGTTAAAPAISLPVSSLTFGNVPIGTSSQKTFTMGNTGNATLTVSSITSDNGAFTVNPTSFQISAGGAAQTVTVTFTPTGAHEYSATITVNHNAAGSPSTVAVSGTGTTAAAPAISLLTSSLAFGNVTIGTPSQKTFAVGNTGNATLTVSSITSDNGAFTVNPTSFQVSAGGAAQTVTVTFTPTAAQGYSATITVNHNAAGSPSTVAVSGTGTTAAAPAISLLTSSLAFGNVVIGTPTQKTFTAGNTGNATLIVSSITSSNGAFTVNPSSFQVSAGGAAQTVTVTFTPTAAQGYSATITVTHNAVGSPGTVTATGTGIGSAAISVQVSTIPFGSVNIGSTSQQSFQVTNSGSLALTVTNITSSNPMFTVSPISFTLSTGNSQNITVTFTPTSGGSQSSTLSFVSNATTSPTVTATGVSETRTTSASTSVGRFNGGIPASSWILMSVPYTLDNTAASVLSSQLTGSTPWKLYTYQNGENVDITNASDAFTTARGLWFKTVVKSGSFNLSFGAGQLVGGPSYTMTIPSGWSLVGPPFLSEEASWSPVNTTAGSSGIRVYKYNHEQSQWVLLNPATERMKPFGGYAVYNGTGSSAQFTFVRGGVSTKVVEWESSGDGWYAGLDIGGSLLRVGQHRLAQEGIDVYDYPMPPPRPESAVDESYISDKLWSDIKPLTSKGLVSWQVNLDPQVTHSIKPTELENFPSDWRIVVQGIPFLGVKDLSPGETIQLPDHLTSSFRFTVLAGPRELVEQAIVPREFALNQNYPNPFNPTTAISYQLLANSFVTLTVFDVLGREVTTLVNAPQNPGYYTVSWGGQDAAGKRVASGVYFYEMQAEKFIAVRKMILLQ